jgi:hypothetical protein
MSEMSHWSNEIKDTVFHSILVFSSNLDARGNLYFLRNNGVWCFNFEKDNYQRLPLNLPQHSNWRTFCVENDFIYYFSAPHEIAKASLNSLDKREIIISKSMLEAVPGYEHEAFIDKVDGDFLIIEDSTFSTIAYHLKTGKLFRLFDLAGSYAILGNFVYYVGRWDYSVYRKSLSQPSSKAQLVLGEGIAYPPWGTIRRYNEVCTVNNRLFFVSNDEIYEFKANNQHALVSSFGNSIQSINGKLYFSDENKALCSYNPDTGKITVICDDSAFKARRDSDYRIVKDRVFFARITTPPSDIRHVDSIALEE